MRANATSGTAHAVASTRPRTPWPRADETVVLTASATGSLNSGTATLTITDNDAAPTAVTLSLNPELRERGGLRPRQHHRDRRR